MALPASSQSALPLPGTPATLAAAKRTHNAKRRPADDSRRPAAARRNSLRRIKDSTEDLRRTRTRGGSSGTIDTTLTNITGSPSAGRSFTVANINNGIIYLRPVVRAGNQRNRPTPDPFVFPATPPDSSHLDTSTLRPPSNAWRDSISGSRTPPPDAPPQILVGHESAKKQLHSPPKPVVHVRSRSFSTVDEHASQTTEPGTFKVVIERPSARRPKTAGSLPVLEVPIPHYRLGSPRFSAKGTAILRSSVNTRASGTEDPRSSIFTPHTHSSFLSRRHSEAYSPALLPYRTTMEKTPVHASTAPSSARVSKIPIGPQLYDALTLNPDDQAVVRFSPSGDIVAATPSRLIAHITSPSFLDYELLSDFFLTFRSFLAGHDLVAYLISRLRWAVNRQDDFGRIVRVRTFVALRHWILNYFVDDFVPNYRLRLFFCQLVNALYKDLQARDDGGGGDIKIVSELKKCWRRTCAPYWDDAESIGNDLPEHDIVPGGRMGSRDFVEDPLPTIQPTISMQTRPTTAKQEYFGANPSDQFASKHMDWVKKPRHTPTHSFTSPHVSSQDYDGVPMPSSPPTSEQSMHVFSCSIPMRGLGRGEPDHDVPLYPHPVPARIAATPQYTVSIGRATRPSHTHKRSGSFSDALRDHRAPMSMPKTATPDARFSTVSKIPGSLVRGAIFQPGSPYVENRTPLVVLASQSLGAAENSDAALNDIAPRPGYGSSPGMKKILGSVRRALSSKQGPGTAGHMAVTGERTSPTSSARDLRVPGASTTSNSGGVQKRRYARPQTRVRIDVLAAKVVESFQDAVKSELENEKSSQQSYEKENGFDFEFDKPEKAESPKKHLSAHQDPKLQSNVTTGSRSILIMDDTGAAPLPLMSGALPVSTSAPKRQTLLDRSSQGGSTAKEYLSEFPIEMAQSPPTSVQAVQPSDVQDLQKPSRTSSNSIQHSSVGQAQFEKSVLASNAASGRNSSYPNGDSIRSIHSRRDSLRRVASYDSGLEQYQARAGVASSAISTVRSMSSDNDPFFLERAPARQLRRRPGGDLRAADNVHDLEQTPRPHSTGTISDRTHSVVTSVTTNLENLAPLSDELDERSSEFDRAITEAEMLKKKQISLVDTHSSQPNLRPSFEAEVAKLAALPDDVDDDGGIESALMKLEGRYEKKSPPQVTVDAPETYRPAGAPQSNSTDSYIGETYSYQSQASNTHNDDTLHRPLSLPEARGSGMYRLSGENFNTRGTTHTASAVESEDSFSSIPLLDRGISEITVAQKSPGARSEMRASAKPAPLNTVSSPERRRESKAKQTKSAGSSLEYVVETDSMKRIPKGGTVPAAAARQSFLLNEDQDLSDMSDDGSAMIAKSEDDSHGVRSFFDDESPAPESGEKMLQHPMRHPPTPPLTANQFSKSMPQVDTSVVDRGLPTPGMTPTSRMMDQPFAQTSQPAEPAIELQDLHKDLHSQTPAHLPFVLAYDSETLAQQLTIIEKDALDEIDWKELIELRWKQSSPKIRDWVEYLRTQEPRGVDVVIARFNLVVKWALSEIVLTENMEERARCIVKYIHIASHARRLRNYATMYQIAIALLSADCARLKRTWAMIPAAECHTMRELEAVVQPLRNFHNLRVEMETASTEEGCIPFIGIYTRDLIYNAQKPALIDGGPVDGEHLVNFERHHTAAMIVKSLLRLLEASSKYSFKPEPHIISKCLWIAALSDEEIHALSLKCE